MAKRRRFLALLGGEDLSTSTFPGAIPTATPVASNADLEVKLSKQANWSAARDKVVLGSAGGGIDGGQWQLPMPQMISEGAISHRNKVTVLILAMLRSQGNGIAAANTVKDGNLSINLRRSSPGYFETFSRKHGRKYKATYTFPKANQDDWIPYWLAGNGIDPDQAVERIQDSAPETRQGMRHGAMEACSTGDPWPSRNARDNIGCLAATTVKIWKSHPEDHLAVRADWIERNPKAAVVLQEPHALVPARVAALDVLPRHGRHDRAGQGHQREGDP